MLELWPSAWITVPVEQLTAPQVIKKCPEFDFSLTMLSNVKLHYVDGKYMKLEYRAPVRW